MSERIVLDGIEIDALTEDEVVARVREALDRGEGGRIVTPNVDILRRAGTDPEVRDYLDDATVVVADGAPLVWASKLAGTPLPERVAGSDLIWSLSAGLGQDGRSVYVLGGEPADPGFVDGAGRAAAELAAASPGLRIAGWRSPDYGFERDWYELSSVCGEVIEAKPDLVYVGIGFPKQEWLISLLRPELPFTWFLGCGAAVNFVTGDQERAPKWMQRSGLEWAHRLSNEPRRLAGRYLRHDAPYALRLLASKAVGR
ncbi:WecB/TagA/CpsF family glycosyltransferase [Micromonospora sp. CPCC 205371]|nr:WecB/TagA/CpsF family glycosyltransferase [Micromonospora sp. CPCC 205371]